MRKIQLLVPDNPTAPELYPYLQRIDSAHWYSNFGPLVLELERGLTAHFGAHSRRALSLTTVSNGTLGLELALAALGLRPGARVLVPALTFIATATAIARAGCEPVLCDVDRDTWLLTPEIARRAIDAIAVDAVMPVSTYGSALDSTAWDEFSRTRGLPVVVDAAAAFGNQHAGDHITHVFSMHATKVLSAAEGGFVVSANAELIARVRRMTNFGIELATGLVDISGTNAKLSEYHAAVALAMLARWEQHAARRISLHAIYLESIARACPRVRLQRRPANGVYSIMPVLLPRGSGAAAIAARLRTDGIETRRWYCPTIQHQPAFKNARRAGSLEVVDELNDHLLALPFHPFLSAPDIEYVCARLAAALAATA